MLELICNTQHYGGAEVFLNIVNNHLESRIHTPRHFQRYFTRQIVPLNLGPKISKLYYDGFLFGLYRRLILAQLDASSILFTQFKKEQIVCSHPAFDRYPRFTFEHGPMHAWLRLYRPVFRRFQAAMRRYDKRFCGSLATKALLERDLGVEYVHIPYGVEYAPLLAAGERAERRAALGVPADRLVVSFADRPLRGRGYHDLLALLARRKFPHVFWIFGSRKERFRSPNEVKFWGWRKDLDEFLMLSDYFVNPSTAQGEAFPLRLVQAMMTGNGIVSCDGPFRAEMEREFPFETTLPRVRGRVLIAALGDYLAALRDPLPPELRERKNDFVRRRHSVGEMIARLGAEIFGPGRAPGPPTSGATA